MFKIQCNNCNHIFYDVTVECNTTLSPICPVCDNKEKLTIEKMKLPKGKKWAEDIGCVHK